MDLLPKVSAEDLDERNLERRDLAVHEDARKVELHLETDVDVGAVDRGRPPEREATVRDLVKTRALGVCELPVGECWNMRTVSYCELHKANFPPRNTRMTA